jgi:hypothetical protein
MNASSAKNIDWENLAQSMIELATEAMMEVGEIERFYSVARKAVERVEGDDDFVVPLQVSCVRDRITIDQDDTAEVVGRFLSTNLPRYSLVSLIARMEMFFDDIRIAAGYNRSKLKRGFGFPVPPGFTRDSLDRTLNPVISRYVELKAARNLIVHNNGLIDDLYLKRAGGLSRGKAGEPYPATDEVFWEAFTACNDVITIYLMLWSKFLEAREKAVTKS